MSADNYFENTGYDNKSDEDSVTVEDNESLYDDDDDDNDDDENDEDDDDDENYDDNQSDNKQNDIDSEVNNYNNNYLKDNNTFSNRDNTNSDIELDDDDDDDDNDSYLQKFNEDIKKNYILEEHPECISHNYDEIKALCNVIRDKNNNIIDNLHKTIPYLTKYERTRIIGQRAKQLDSGATPLIDVPENIIDGYLIAQLELEQKRIPFIIRRPLFGGKSEYWKVQDLEMLL